jgi:hypothetical protein
MSMKKAVYVFSTIFIFLIGFWYFYLRDAKEIQILEKGEEVVKKVEEYRQNTNRLPTSLSEIGIAEDDNTDLYLHYQKIDSVNYYVWLGLSFEESKFYYSDSKKWQNGFREIDSVGKIDNTE